MVRIGRWLIQRHASAPVSRSWRHNRHESRSRTTPDRRRPQRLAPDSAVRHGRTRNDHLFKPQRRMTRVLLKQRVVAVGEPADRFGKLSVSFPKGAARKMSHSSRVRPFRNSSIASPASRSSLPLPASCYNLLIEPRCVKLFEPGAKLRKQFWRQFGNGLFEVFNGHDVNIPQKNWHCSAIRDKKHRDEILKKELHGNAKVEVSRFNGLGEMMAAQLKDATMDPRSAPFFASCSRPTTARTPKNRVERLMGTKPYRASAFIQECAEFADESALDVSRNSHAH